MTLNPEERFWSGVDKRGPDDCWLWTRSGPKGYGQFSDGSRLVLVHRFAYELLVGPIPEGLTIDHLCRVPRCVNPAHLEPVTELENIRRGTERRTHCRAGHEFTEGNTETDENGHRRCALCRCRSHLKGWRRRGRLAEIALAERDGQLAEARGQLERLREAARPFLVPWTGDDPQIVALAAALAESGGDPE